MLARKLLKARLAACVSFREGFVSFYEWKGRLTKQKEVWILIKTSTKLLPRLEAMIKKIHPYQNPEILSVPVQRASKEYAAWMQKVML